MTPASSIMAICLSFVLWVPPIAGKVISDVDQDTDDDWPVLCPPDTFYSREQELCLTCSRCPINNIITSPCHGLYDTKCGPFYDFQGLLPADEDPTTMDDKNTSEQQNGGSDNFWQNSEESVNTFNNLKSGTVNADSKSGSLHTSLDSIEYSDSEWKSLTIALIVIVSIFLVLVIMGVVYFLRRRSLNAKQMSCEYSPAPEKVFV